MYNTPRSIISERGYVSLVMLALIPSFMYFFQSVGLKMFGSKCKSKGASDYLFATFYFSLSALIILPFVLVNGFDVTSALWGIPFGIGLSVFLVLFGKAINAGGIAFTNFIMALALIFPVFGSAIIYGTAITMLQYIAIGIFFIAFYFICFGRPKGEILPVSNKMAWVYRFFAFAISGLVGILINVASKEAPNYSQYSFLLVGFVIAGAVNYVLFAIDKHKNKREEYKLDKQFLLWAFVVALTTAGGNIVITSLVGVIASAILFPIANGGQIIIASIGGVFFKEKLTLKMIVGIILGVVAIVCLNM